MPQKVTAAIVSTLVKLKLHFNGQNVIAQFWASTESGSNNPFLLTPTCQPWIIYGNNYEHKSYQEIFLKQKYYVNREYEVAFGIPGRSVLKGTPQQTRNVHDYDVNQRPYCGQEPFYSRQWGCFCVPVIVGERIVGVLEFVTDNLKDSYDHDIAVVREVLQNEGLESLKAIKNEHPKTAKKYDKRIRKTDSSDLIKYCCLVPQLGLTKKVAAGNFGCSENTLTNICRRVKINEWPWISNTTRRAYSVHGTLINQISSSKTGSSAHGIQINQLLSSETNYSAQGTQISTDETTSFGTSDASFDILTTPEIDNIMQFLNDEETTIAGASASAPAPEFSENIYDLSEVIQNISSPPETHNYHIAPNEELIAIDQTSADFMAQCNDNQINQSYEATGSFEDIEYWDTYYNSIQE
ncbi:uncharacterized protein [Rutidosis leptorrhynchoides]|uniref:uncharacterized protein n=1 Tax=Rutidosis leptorrhynchoides TaxID=125765 RepID=UPI003A99CC76